MVIMTGAFLGGPDTTLEAGTASISLSIMTRDRQNLATASWTIMAEGYSKTVSADASGRAYVVVPSGKTYTVTLTHQGNYANDGPQTVITESKMNYGVLFDLADYDSVFTVIKIVTIPSTRVTASEIGGVQEVETTSDESGEATFNGFPVGSKWEIAVPSLNKSKTVTVNGIYVEVKIYPETYGFKIKRSESDPNNRVEYIEDAIGMTPAHGLDMGSWANTELFRTLIKPVVRQSNGVFKDLNRRNLNQCTDGSSSNISTVGNDVFTEFPGWYVSESRDSTYNYVRICSMKKDDTYHAMHAMDNGIQRDCFHVGCCGAYSTGNKCYSSMGKQPSRSISTQNFAIQCQARGAGFDQFSWYAWNFIAILFVLAYKSTNSQNAMARGYVDGSDVQTENRTSFSNDFGLAGSSSGTEQMSFLWIQNLWGNMYQFLGGAKTNSQNQLMTIQNGKNITTNESDFTLVGSGGPTSGFSGYISEMDMSSSKVGFFPKTTSGSSTTHWCDGGNVSPSYFPRVGGYYHGGDGAGLFYVVFDYSATGTNSNYGSRLMYKGGR